ncbi:MAG: HAMP domain-containing histidine kinase [Gammaproteobacteria bacterium]|nr:HAMP domain-containing histidine kinase [Gammaproteobacteria bacterium]
MATRIFQSSTFRLALLYLVLFSVSVLLLLGFIYWSTAGFMSRQTDVTIQAEITGLAERYERAGLAGLTALIAERVARQRPTTSSVYLLTDARFRPIVGNLDQWPNEQASPAGWLNFRLEASPQDDRGAHKARARSFTLRGQFHLLVGRDIHELEKIQQTIIRTLIWGMLLMAVLGIVGGTMMSRSMVRRIEAINETSREIMSGDLSRRIQTKGTGDDFDKLAENLNEMLDQIETLMEGVQRVSDNIAHDLRTPLARLRNRLEALKLQQTNRNTYADEVDKALAEADRLLSTFSALLRIARVESDTSRIESKEVNLNSLIHDVVELYEPLAEQKSQNINQQLTIQAAVKGDQDLLFQALANLVDNAIKYSPSGGTIKIELSSESQGAALIVTDEGPGVPEATYDKIFQRFFRLEKSRTTAGNGLGLSLVAAVAKRHKLQIELQDNQPGLRVKINFQDIVPPGQP